MLIRVLNDRLAAVLEDMLTYVRRRSLELRDQNHVPVEDALRAVYLPLLKVTRDGLIVRYGETGANDWGVVQYFLKATREKQSGSGSGSGRSTRLKHYSIFV